MTAIPPTTNTIVLTSRCRRCNGFVAGLHICTVFKNGSSSAGDSK